MAYKTYVEQNKIIINPNVLGISRHCLAFGARSRDVLFYSIHLRSNWTIETRQHCGVIIVPHVTHTHTQFHNDIFGRTGKQKQTKKNSLTLTIISHQPIHVVT